MKKFKIYWFLLSASLCANAALILTRQATRAVVVYKEEEMGNIDRVVRFLGDAGAFHIATIDGDRPQVRPFGAALNIDGKLTLCTGAWKNVAKQIAANPNVAISAMLADGRYIRISGRLADASTDESRGAFFAAMPNLAELYKGKEKEFLVLSFESGEAVVSDMAGNSETIPLE
jgi:uncharacterized pyridoxamine 5'-phosphate oxidase family protein